MNRGLKSISVRSRVASRKCKGKEVDDDLQALTAQVRKFVVRSFILDFVKGGQIDCTGGDRR